jgi:hypothetical protein
MAQVRDSLGGTFGRDYVITAVWGFPHLRHRQQTLRQRILME